MVFVIQNLSLNNGQAMDKWRPFVFIGFALIHNAIFTRATRTIVACVLSDDDRLN